MINVIYIYNMKVFPSCIGANVQYLQFLSQFLEVPVASVLLSVLDSCFWTPADRDWECKLFLRISMTVTEFLEKDVSLAVCSLKLVFCFSACHNVIILRWWGCCRKGSRRKKKLLRFKLCAPASCLWRMYCTY